MAVITAILFLSALISLILATLVAFQGSRQLSHILFVGISMCFVAWHTAVAVFMSTNSVEVAMTSAKVYYVAAGAFPPLLLAFSLIYPWTRRIVSRVTMLLIGLVGTAMSLMIIATPDFMVRSLTVYGTDKVVEVEPTTYLLYTAYFVLLFAIAMFVAFRKYFTSKGEVRMQAGLYALGILINSIPGFFANLYLPFFGIYDYVWVGPASSVFFLVLVTYSITRHGMFSIRTAAVRSTAYIFTLLTLVSIYYAVAYSLTLMFPGNESLVSLTPANMVITLALALLFQPVKRFFDKVTNKIFYRDSYDIDTFYKDLNKTLSETSDLHALLQRTSRYIGESLKSESVAFFAYYEKKHVTVGEPRTVNLPVDDAHQLDDYTRLHVGIIRTENVEALAVRRLLVSHKVHLVLPLRYERIVIGYLLLGPHKGGGYTARDLKTLETIADELAIAVQNALSVHAVKELNDHLEQRIAYATKELRASNAQLQKLDEAKDEFISMASHQLRTPLTSIKGYISMLIEGDVGSISKEQKELLDEVFISSERMVRLIGDFLNVSRLQTGKFVIERHPVDVALLVRRELDSLLPNAAARKMKFAYKMPKNIQPLELDENKIQQVVMNFADNALYYSKEGGTITVNLKKVPGFIEFTVKDNGIGVPKTEQRQLFSKFFRATNARKARPDGTGVGLFLAKKVIEDHGGTLIFESEEGKGSTFGFRLPVA